MRTQEYDEQTTATPVPRQASDPAARRRPGRAGRRRVLTACGAVALVPAAAVLAARALDVDGPAPLPQLLAFLPWLLVPGWLALACGFLARRALLSCGAVAVLAATAWFVQPYGPDRAAPPGAPHAQVRVLTANLEFGQATGALLDVLRRERPHLVAVQECDRRCAAALETSALRETYPYRVIAGSGPAEGSALLSVYPLSDSGEIPGVLSMPGAVADVRGVPVRVQVVHPMPPRLGSMTAWREELAAVRRAAEDRGEVRTVIAGDFNATQDHAAFRAVLDTGLRDSARLLGHSRTPTWPSATAPPFGAQIDHVLLSERLVPVDARFLDLPGTDHRALLTDVQVH
ncbi:endonuclease/exonuclease/phosphatase family protein [Streptomyces sp. TRM 70351]|uniref:endonuclease/exonuclease/phosphatase family protein n=1 Tax=Streptomyces sp. TRM 70351 TaxID=3116552 RepID=UPI002E7C53D7|nr:endonuclease/exonuclease/phosphatase family protein [Streptomyces sp. TRM 70351]MEE1926869.1 endonuclease/exonuclease/phosphatase family protein [Streptomyces sp. TRM 70351]